MIYAGNQTPQGNFQRVVDAIKDNIMASTNVADVVRVEQYDENAETFICTALSSGMAISAVALADSGITVGDIALVVYTNTSFRDNLNKIKEAYAQGIAPILANNPESEILHQKSNGVIVGKIWSAN